MSHHHHGQSNELNLAERGAPIDGKPQEMDRRLFMQLLNWEVRDESAKSWIARVSDKLSEAQVPAVIYQDVNNPQGVALLSWSEDPTHFVANVGAALQYDTLKKAVLRPELNMLGRTYSSGYEPDLEYWMLKRPVETVTNEAWPWAVWYPLRRKGAFETLEPKQKGGILREHATIGKAYGEKDFAHDVRLACHGIDANDNEFLVGLLGKELYPLSHVVQGMRGTIQTSQYMEKMGPFFVGHVAARTL